MLTLLILLSLITVVGLGAAVLVKATVQVVLIPLKLILLPFVVAAAVLNIATLLTVVTLTIALLIPVVVIISLIAAPILLVAAVLG